MDTETKMMRGAVVAGVSVMSLVALVATTAIVSINADAQSPRTPPVPHQPNSGARELGGETFSGTPVERTKVLTVDNTANVEVRYSASMRHLLARCVNKTTGVSLFVVESDDANTNDGVGPYCDTCAGGATLPPLGTAYLRTSAGTASVACGFVEDWPSAGLNFTAPGAGGMSTTTADASYLRLDGTNDGDVSADIDLPLGFSVDGTTLAVDETTNTVSMSSSLTVDTSTLCVDPTNDRVGIGTCSPSYLFHVQKHQDSGTYNTVENNSAGGNAQAGLYAHNGANGLFMGRRGNSYTAEPNTAGTGWIRSDSTVPNGLAIASGYDTNGVGGLLRIGGSEGATVNGFIEAMRMTWSHASAAAPTGVVAINEQNFAVTLKVDSDTEEDAFRVEAATTANLALNAAGSIVGAGVDASFTASDDVLLTATDDIVNTCDDFSVAASGGITIRGGAAQIVSVQDTNDGEIWLGGISNATTVRLNNSSVDTLTQQGADPVPVLQFPHYKDTSVTAPTCDSGHEFETFAANDTNDGAGSDLCICGAWADDTTFTWRSLINAGACTW